LRHLMAQNIFQIECWQERDSGKRNTRSYEAPINLELDIRK
jgi:hypothetical protein